MIRDDEPFANRTDFRGVVQAVGGELAAKGLEAHASQVFRQRVEGWARAHAFPIVESQLRIEREGVAIAIPIYEVTAETAVIRTTALAPTKASLTVEPRRWTHRFGRSFKTGLEIFDRKWHAVASNEGLGRLLLDEATREALASCTAWCQATYSDGVIVVRLDREKLAGEHLLEGVAVASALASVRPQEAAYR